MVAPFWLNEGPPKTRIQRAAFQIDEAFDALEQSATLMPHHCWHMTRNNIREIRERLEQLRAHLTWFDPQWCDTCERWTDDPIHKVQCEPNSFQDDEHKARRDALLTHSVYGPLGTTTQRGTDD